MLKTTLKITALSAVSLTLLSACGLASKVDDVLKEGDNINIGVFGGSDSAARSSSGAANIAASERSEISARSTVTPTISDGISSVYRFNTKFGTTGGVLINSPIEDTFSLSQMGTASIAMAVNGIEYIFTLAEFGTWSTPDIHEGITARNNVRLSPNSDTRATLYDIIDGTDADYQGTYVYYSVDSARSFGDDDDFTSGYATVGVRTIPSAVASQTATATYEGELSLRAFRNDRFDFNLDEGPEDGDLTMTVNFDADTISGTGTIRLNAGAGIVTFDSAPISGNGFAGTFTMDQALRTDMSITDNPTGNYAGNFFGPAADDVAGVMNITTGAFANGDVLRIGGFRADRK